MRKVEVVLVLIYDSTCISARQDCQYIASPSDSTMFYKCCVRYAVVDFYKGLGFEADPDGIKGMFWYPRY